MYEFSIGIQIHKQRNDGGIQATVVLYSLLHSAHHHTHTRERREDDEAYKSNRKKKIIK